MNNLNDTAIPADINAADPGLSALRRFAVHPATQEVARFLAYAVLIYGISYAGQTGMERYRMKQLKKKQDADRAAGRTETLDLRAVLIERISKMTPEQQAREWAKIPLAQQIVIQQAAAARTPTPQSARAPQAQAPQAQA